MKGIIYIVSSPSGCGKTTIIRNFLKHNRDFYFSISHTTRLPRKNEKNGIDYYFVTKDEFKKMIENNEFLEWAVVHNEYYGTSKRNVLEKIYKGIDVILDIDVQGAEKIRKNKELKEIDIVSIFIFPPSFEELKRRLLKRKSDDEKTINIRLKNAYKELERFEEYDYIIVNENLENAILDFQAIIRSTKLKTVHQKELVKEILNNWEVK